MPELRWSLLIIGLLVVAGVYLYSRGRASRSNHPERDHGGDSRRAEPVISGEDLWGDELDREPDAPNREPPRPHPAPVAGGGRPAADVGRIDNEPETGVWHDGDEAPLREDAPSTPSIATDAAPEPADAPPPDPDRIVAMRVAAPAGHTLSAEEMVLKLRELGLRHGKYGIFHRHVDDGPGQPLFSVASMTEPGSFDLKTLRETRLPGVSLFMVLPGPGDPVECFDTMVQTARDLARDLQGEILDESGSTWSIQRERYVREDLIRYRLHYGTRHA